LTDFLFCIILKMNCGCVSSEYTLGQADASACFFYFKIIFFPLKIKNFSKSVNSVIKYT
jgi:hypothetical protein